MSARRASGGEGLETAAWAAVFVVLGSTLWFCMGPGKASDSDADADFAREGGTTSTTPASTMTGSGTSPTGSAKKGSRTPAPHGWIPPSAREATETARLRADPDHDPLCASPPSVVEQGKSAAVGLERELRSATKISDAEESAIGARMERALPNEPSFRGNWDRDEDVRRYGLYLGALVKFLAPQSRRPGIVYRVHVVHRPEFNAAALPGGLLMVYTGLLESDDRVRDEAEAVGVLGHEINHVEKRHTIAAYQYAKVLLGDTSDEAAIAVRMLAIPLSSEWEYEADDGGILMGIEAQYDPQAVVNLWRRHAGSRGDRQGGVLGQLGSLIATHPPPARRACKAMARVDWARENARCDRLYDGRTNLEQHDRTGPEHAY